MRYLSVCSGIEAATQAWHPLGWSPAAFSEIDKFPSAVLAHHYPHVPNLGDMTKFEEWPDHAIDLLVGGTPCQSFSVAGLRRGLADPRGNLMLTYLAIAGRYKPRWLVWENVPGALSVDGGRAFASLVGGMAELGYHAAWRVLDAQYVRVSGHPRAVPQRRKRVFVVGYLGDWRRAAAVFLEREGMSGDPPPRRETGERAADSSVERAPSGGWPADVAPTLGTAWAGRHPGSSNQDFIAQKGGLFVQAAFGGNNQSGSIDVATAVNAHGGPHGRLDFESETFVAAPLGAKKDGGWRGDLDNDTYVPIAIQERAISENPDAGPDGVGVRQDGAAYTLEARQVPQAVAFDLVQMTSKTNRSTLQDISPTMAKESQLHAVQGWAVRRLTPTECERLQGFPQIHKSVRIEVCEAEKLEAASSAAQNSQSQKLGSNAHALVHVRINCERSAVEIHSAARLLWSASDADEKSSSPLSMPVADFVRLAALMTATAVPPTQAGKAASPQSTNSFSGLWNGSASVRVSGREIEELVSDAERFTSTANAFTKSITSPSGRLSQNCEPSLQTLSCCVTAAISSFIPSETRQASSYAVIVETITGYTAVPYRGKPAADGPRYKALGNSMAVNAMSWIGERIANVERVSAILEARAA